MKYFQYLFTILALLALVHSEESGCLIDEDEPRIVVGEKIDIEGLCQTITCVSDNNMIIESCPQFTATRPGPNYHIEQHFQKAFPDCCPVYEPDLLNAISKDENENEIDS